MKNISLYYAVMVMDEEEYHNKYMHLRILKSVQEYLKSDENEHSALYPIRVPDELLYQTLKSKGAKKVDSLIHYIFKLGLSIWSEKQYNAVFGSHQSLEKFIELVKKQNREDT
jgi:hypothetical protein